MYFSATENLPILGEAIEKYGPITRLWIGTQLTVYLTGPEELEVRNIPIS